MRMFKGQAHMMEYILMTLFIVIIIGILIFFLMSWQFTQLRATESKSEGEKALFVMKFFIKSPFFTKDESIFDDLNDHKPNDARPIRLPHRFRIKWRRAKKD